MTSSVPAPCLLTTGELALLLHVTRKSVSKWCNEGRIKFHPFPGRNSDRRIPIEEALAFARREKQYVRALEAVAIRRGVSAQLCPSLLVVSPTPQYVLPLLQEHFDAQLACSSFRSGLLLDHRTFDAVLFDTALGRDQVLEQMAVLSQRCPHTFLAVLAGEDDANLESWWQAHARRVWQKPIGWKLLAEQLATALGVAVPPVPPLRIAG